MVYSGREAVYRLESFVMSCWLCVCCLLFVRVGNVVEKKEL